MLWESTLANFLGSLGAAAVVWLMVTRLYEFPRSKREKRELVSVAYALILRELEAAAVYCNDLLQMKPDEITVSLPITQAWETLHSTEAFKFFPPGVSEKLVGCYSLLLKLKKHIELTHMFLFGEQFPMSGGENPYGRLRQGINRLADPVAREIIRLQMEFDALLRDELAKFSKKEKELYDEAYRRVGGVAQIGPKPTG
jgi:hypothetical protein